MIPGWSTDRSHTGVPQEALVGPLVKRNSRPAQRREVYSITLPSANEKSIPNPENSARILRPESERA